MASTYRDTNHPDNSRFIRIPYIIKLNHNKGSVYVEDVSLKVHLLVQWFINGDYNIEKYSNLVYDDFNRII
jgi:hypothetical protein